MIRRITFLVVLVAAAGLGWGCDDDDGTNWTDQNFPVVLFEGRLEAGVYRFCWDQLDGDGELARIDRGYAIWIDCRPGWDTIVHPSMADSNESAGSANCDTSFGGGLLPRVYSVELNDAAYAPGDTIAIDVYLPAADSLRVFVDLLAPI